MAERGIHGGGSPDGHWVTLRGRGRGSTTGDTASVDEAARTAEGSLQMSLGGEGGRQRGRPPQMTPWGGLGDICSVNEAARMALGDVAVDETVSEGRGGGGCRRGGGLEAVTGGTLPLWTRSSGRRTRRQDGRGGRCFEGENTLNETHPTCHGGEWGG